MFETQFIKDVDALFAKHPWLLIVGILVLGALV